MKEKSVDCLIWLYTHVCVVNWTWFNIILLEQKNTSKNYFFDHNRLMLTESSMNIMSGKRHVL